METSSQVEAAPRIFNSASKTEKGVRKEKPNKPNEDSLLVPRQIGTYIVAGIFDGMGGHAAGDVASNMALEATSARLAQQLPEAEPDDVEDILTTTFEEVSDQIETRAREEKNNMGTTGVVAVLSAENELIVANAGDSRVYVYDQTQPDGKKMRLVTIDQILLRIQENPEQARKLINALAESPTPGSMLRRPNDLDLFSSLGSGGPTIEIHREQLQPGNKVFVVSDGISDLLTTGEMERIITTGGSLHEVADAMCRRVDTVYATPSDPLYARRKSYIDDKSISAFEVPEDKVEEKDVNKYKTGKLPELEEEAYATQEHAEVFTEEQKWQMIRLEGSKSREDLYRVLKQIGSIDTPSGTIDYTQLIQMIEAVKEQTMLNDDRGFLSIPDVYELRSVVKGHVTAENATTEGRRIDERQFAYCSGLPELYVYLRKMGQIQGNRDTFSSDDLINKIEAYAKGEEEETVITSKNELRFLVRGLTRVLHKKEQGEPITAQDALSASSIMEYVAVMRNAQVAIRGSQNSYDGPALAFLAERAFSRALEGNIHYITDGPREDPVGSQLVAKVGQLINLRVGQLQPQKQSPVAAQPQQIPSPPAQPQERKGFFQRIKLWRP